MSSETKLPCFHLNCCENVAMQRPLDWSFLLWLEFVRCPGVILYIPYQRQRQRRYPVIQRSKTRFSPLVLFLNFLFIFIILDQDRFIRKEREIVPESDRSNTRFYFFFSFSFVSIALLLIMHSLLTAFSSCFYSIMMN